MRENTFVGWKRVLPLFLSGWAKKSVFYLEIQNKAVPLHPQTTRDFGV